MALDQGPGENIDFCLITAGIDINPNHGGQSEVYYDFIKQVIQERASINYEKPDARLLEDFNVSNFLEAYDSSARNLYQALFGLVEHNNGWTEEALYEAINNTPLSQKYYPNNNEFSIDWYASIEDGFTIFKNIVLAGVESWQQVDTFYYSNRIPSATDGETGDVWLAYNSGKLELWYKPIFRWVRLDEYIDQNGGTLEISETDPGNSANSWWLDISGLKIRKYTNNMWGQNLDVTVSQTEPPSPQLDDIWIQYNAKNRFQIYQWNGAKWASGKFSEFNVLDKDTNSFLKGTEGDNNYTIDCGDLALLGGPVQEGGDLEIRKDGTIINIAARCLNFKGPDFTVIEQTECVDIEHNPYTTLPEQSTTPSTVANSGIVFSREVNGVTELYFLDSNGNDVQLTNNGSTTQNIFLDVNTTNATAGQTVFSVPNAKGIISMKINGLDTPSFTFSSGTVTYDEVTANYTIKNGDEVTFLYYG